MRAGGCGHVRCYGTTACRLHLPPPSEALPEGTERLQVRATFGAMMLNLMDSDTPWALAMGRLAELDGTR